LPESAKNHQKFLSCIVGLKARVPAIQMRDLESHATMGGFGFFVLFLWHLATEMQSM
jgi:hypothetical protein